MVRVVQAGGFTRGHLRAAARSWYEADRRKRIAVWKVFEVFLHLCHEQRIRDVEMAMYECGIIRRRLTNRMHRCVVKDKT